MTDYAKAVITFLKQFGKVYQPPVASGTALPYMSLGIVENSFSENTLQQIAIYTRQTSYADAYAVVDNINSNIGEGGIIWKYNGIILAIYKGSPFAQNLNEEDGTIRAVIVNLIIKQY